MNGYDYYTSNFDFDFDHCFACPNTTAPAQATENFWQQTPEVSNFTYTYYDSVTGSFFHFDPAFSTDNMDTKVVKIGSATNHSSKRAAAPVKEYVDVYVGNQLVKTVPLRQLTRFSKAASRAFPAPSPAEKVAKVGEEKVKKDEGKTADVEEKTVNVEGKNVNVEEKTENAEGKIEGGTDDTEAHVDVKALNEGVEDLTTSEKPADSAAKPEKSTTPPNTMNGKKEISPEAKQKPASPSSKKNDKLTAVAESQQEPNKIFRVELVGVPNYPTAKAIVQSLTWMEMNQAMHNNMRLLPFYVPDESEGYPFAAYIDIYAAALAFDLRPFPVNLRTTIFNLITSYRPFVADVARIVERVPLDDSIVKRMISSCYEHESEYEGSEWADLVEYSKMNQPLNQRFIDVEKARKRFRSKQSRQQMQAEAMLRQQHGWGTRGDATEHHDSNNGGSGHGKDHGRKGAGNAHQAGKSSAQTTVPTSPTVKQIGQGNKTSSGGQTNGGGKSDGGGKKREGNGKGIGGKHVPGA
ncbi:hypothetical protein LTR74_002060 [Friedmanniomyces endolithicus]|nr:hypothetical protein LTR74_002060 [Friedmanniomyces endolithicus]